MSGGRPARRAVLRWATRLFRREWRQQALVLALLSIAVAAAVAGSTIAVDSASESTARFGGGGALVHVDSSDGSIDDGIAAARERFGTVDVVAHTTTAVPGSLRSLDVRDQDPNGIYSKPMLDVLSGRYPTAAGEVALTHAAAQLFGATIGSTVTIARESAAVVGIVENPAALDDTFVLVAPGAITAPDTYALLISKDAIDRGLNADGASLGHFQIEVGGADAKAVAAAVLVATTLALALVALIAAAAFVVVAQRRQRQLGLLAAIGATKRQVRLVMIANGLIVGVVSALIGGVLGFLAWVVAAPAVETAAEHRIDRFDMPWTLVGAIILIAIVMSTLAAWQPARSASRQSIVSALSGRPARPRPIHRSMAVAGVFVVGGTVAIVLSAATTDHVKPVLLITGMLGVVLGAVFLAPAAVRSLGAVARRLPFAPRLALRDLARHQARAGAALAAITLSLGIAVGVIAVSAASADRPNQGNLSSHELLIRTGDPREGLDATLDAAEVATLDTRAAAIVATLGTGYTSVPLDLAFAASTTGGAPSPIPASLGVRRDAHSLEEVGLPYVATLEVLAAYGIDAATIKPDTDVLTSRTGPMLLIAPPASPSGNRKDLPDFNGPPTAAQTVDLPTWSEAPNSLITEAALERLGLVTARAGWIVESAHGFTNAQIAAARTAAADAGLTIEVRDQQDGLSSVRNGATLIGALLAIAVVAMTVGLIRGESARDIRTLTATGAAARTRRAVTASTAAALATLGVALGISGAYVALIAAFHAKLAKLAPIPFGNLLALAIGLPAAAAAAGWLLAGREPTRFSRQVLD